MHLKIKLNKFTEHPNFTSVSSEAKGWTKLGINDLYPVTMKTVCHFKQVLLRGKELVTVPRFYCPETQSPESLYLSYYDFRSVKDFSNLTTLTLLKLRLQDCIVPVFPNFSMISTNLRDLKIIRSNLTVIHSTDLRSLNLDVLDLSNNNLKTFAAEIFHVTKELSLTEVTNVPSDSWFWHNALCPTKSKALARLDFTSSFTAIHLHAPLANTLCSRDKMVTINLSNVSIGLINKLFECMSCVFHIYPTIY